MRAGLLFRFCLLKLAQYTVYNEGHAVHLKRNRRGVLRIEHVESASGYVKRGGEKVPTYFRWYDGEEYVNLRVTDKNGRSV